MRCGQLPPNSIILQYNWSTLGGDTRSFSQVLQAPPQPWKTMDQRQPYPGRFNMGYNCGGFRGVGVGCPMEEVEVVVDSNLVGDLETGTGNRGIMADKILIRVSWRSGRKSHSQARRMNLLRLKLL